MVRVENIELDSNELLCVAYVDRETALHLAESILRQVSEGTPNVAHNTFKCEGEADLFKVAVI